MEEHRKQNKYPKLHRLSKRGIYERKQAYKLKKIEKSKMTKRNCIDNDMINDSNDNIKTCHRCSESFPMTVQLVFLPRGFTQIPVCDECYSEMRDLYSD